MKNHGGVNGRSVGSSNRYYGTDSLPGYLVRKIHAAMHIRDAPAKESGGCSGCTLVVRGDGPDFELRRVRGGNGIEVVEVDGVLEIRCKKGGERAFFAGSTDRVNTARCPEEKVIDWNHIHVHMGEDIEQEMPGELALDAGGLYEISARLTVNLSSADAMGAMRIEMREDGKMGWSLLSQIPVAYTGSPIPLVIPDLRLYTTGSLIRVVLCNVGGGQISTLPSIAENSIIIKRLF
jgi:hypothetical protein